jgi:hypothetical protein
MLAGSFEPLEGGDTLDQRRLSGVGIDIQQ